tara:strand:- start:727 stop:1023 length:297 start_codon:yes stop_codon:yes gene_type:complete
MNYILIVNADTKPWAETLSDDKIKIVVLDKIEDCFRIKNPRKNIDPFSSIIWSKLPNNTISRFPALINLRTKHPRTHVVHGRVEIEEFLFLEQLMEEE